MKKNLFFFFVIACYLCACSSSNNKIKNGIKIKEDGLHVEEAYLTNNKQSAIGNDNNVQPGERVCLHLTIDGWQEKNGIVFFDASQKTTTSEGSTLAFNPSIFSYVYGAGANIQSAKYVLLYQIIGKLDKHYDYILISFKVWDKTSNKSVSGSYKLHV